MIFVPLDKTDGIIYTGYAIVITLLLLTVLSPYVFAQEYSDGTDIDWQLSIYKKAENQTTTDQMFQCNIATVGFCIGTNGTVYTIINVSFEDPQVETIEEEKVPQFGTIAMMILAVAIISIIAVTAKSRVVPRF